jgi:hypothetical protein
MILTAEYGTWDSDLLQWRWDQRGYCALLWRWAPATVIILSRN